MTSELCRDGKRLVVISESEIASLSSAQPGNCYICVLTAWSSEEIQYDRLSNNIRLLVDKGCVYFICVGAGSEQLHDTIDDAIIMGDIVSNDQTDESTIVTTWHADESLEDVAFFCLSAVIPPDELVCEAIIMILDGRSQQDQALLSEFTG